MSGLIMEPLKYYTQQARQKHKENLQSHFDALHKKSGVDEAQNRATVKKYKAELHAIDDQKKKIAKYKFFRFLLILLAVAGGIAAIYGIKSLTGSQAIGLLYLALGGLGIFLGIYVIKKAIKPRIKNEEEILGKHQKNADALLKEAWEQMAPLNALFQDNDTLRLIEKTMPEIEFHDHFRVEQLAKLVEDYDYINLSDGNSSVLDTLSGELFQNPFLFERELKMEMGTFVYTGTLTISWTEHYTDSEGKRRSRTRTQVLTASLTKPKPYYRRDTRLGYGSLAAPDLTFSRQATHAEDLSEGARERKIKRGERKLRRKAEKALGQGGNFREMVNSEFDVLFGALDRDHEVQFRLMYTPLAQQNTVDLITSEAGYGDDFAFYKKRKYNIIRSEHGQSWVMNPSAQNYRSYDFDLLKSGFLSFNEEYFKSLFFDFAPLMAVPAYQETPADSMKKPMGIISNYPSNEHEVLANAIGANAFAHPKTATDVILKTSIISSKGATDKIEVAAHSFDAIPRLDYVPRMGGDGKMHLVPVHWIEYSPLRRISKMEVWKPADGEARGDVFRHGLAARIV